MARAAWALGLALATCAGVAHGQATATAKPKHPTPPAPAASAAITPGQASPAAPDIAVARVAPLPGADMLRVGPAVSLAPSLRSAVRSRWSTPAAIASRGGGACRGQCATSRIECLSRAPDDGTARCDATWTGCLSTCADLSYGRAAVTP